MSRHRWLVIGAQFVASVFVLSLAVGCGGEPAAGTDPADREKSMTDAKNAMEAAGQLQKADKSKARGKK